MSPKSIPSFEFSLVCLERSEQCIPISYVHFDEALMYPDQEARKSRIHASPFFKSHIRRESVKAARVVIDEEKSECSFQEYRV